MSLFVKHGVDCDCCSGWEGDRLHEKTKKLEELEKLVDELLKADEEKDDHRFFKALAKLHVRNALKEKTKWSRY